MRRGAAALGDDGLRPFSLHLDDHGRREPTAEDDARARAFSRGLSQDVPEEADPQVVDVVEFFLDIGVRDAPQLRLDALEHPVDGRGGARPARDRIVDASEERRVVEEEEVRREDERVLFVDFACRGDLNPQEVVASFFDRGSDAVTLEERVAGRRPGAKIDGVRALEDGDADRDAGGCADASKDDLALRRWRGVGRASPARAGLLTPVERRDDARVLHDSDELRRDRRELFGLVRGECAAPGALENQRPDHLAMDDHRRREDRRDAVVSDRRALTDGLRGDVLGLRGRPGARLERFRRVGCRPHDGPVVVDEERMGSVDGQALGHEARRLAQDARKRVRALDDVQQRFGDGPHGAPTDARPSA